ncbi:MAG: rRNA maturation RNase YbeY [Acidobacteria bacterium]|nr:rRNA maturation RNase YbeY [Acidobacteriota bacterium]
MARVQIKWERRPSRPAAEALRRMISRCVGRLGRKDAEVHVLITGDDRIRELNLRYLGLDQATDVLSFPDGDLLPTGRTLLGEIAISLDTARRQAEELRHGEIRELEELALHGLLHLLGYDHGRDTGEMNDLELKLRKELLS